jgi:hypothetical protein
MRQAGPRAAVLLHRAADLDRFEKDYEAGLIDGVRLQRLTAKAQADVADLDRRIGEAVGRATGSDVLAALDPGQAFLDAPIDVQRAVLRGLLRVRVEPAAKSGARWSADRVVMTRAS